MSPDFNEIGAKLVSHAKNTAEFSARGVLGSLFPYILQASQRMSTRAISKWLADTHGVKISAVSIAKALRNQETYWDEYLDVIEPIAIAVENMTGIDMVRLLTDNEEWYRSYEQLLENAEHACAAEDWQNPYGAHPNAVHKLQQQWFSFDSSIRSRAYQLIINRYANPDADAELEPDQEPEYEGEN